MAKYKLKRANSFATRINGKDVRIKKGEIIEVTKKDNKKMIEKMKNGSGKPFFEKVKEKQNEEDNTEDAKTEKEKLVEEAKELGISNAHTGWNIDTLKKKIAKAKKEEK